MSLQEFFVGMMGASPIEITASVAGLLCVSLVIRRSMWCWPAGLIQVSLYAYIFFNVKLYSDFGLHVIYIFLQFYGWWNWAHGKNASDPEEIEIVAVQNKTLLTWVGISLSGTFLLGLIMNKYTDAALPFADAFTTVTSLVAQWLMTRRELMNWYFWIAVDVVAVWVYLQKNLLPTSVLYGVFLILCLIGVRAWLKQLNAQLQEGK